MRLHLASMLVGAALLGAVVLGLSATAPPARYDELPVVGIPDPRTMVVVRQGSPLEVPDGKMFVLTALGFAPPWPTGSVYVRDSTGAFSGQATSSADSLGQGWWYHINAGTSSVVEAPTWTARGPTMIEVIGSAGPSAGRAWGYVTDSDHDATSLGTSLAPIPLRFVGMNDPRDFRNFGEGQHTIPFGKLLIVETAGDLSIDGVPEVYGRNRKLPPGLVVRGGSVVLGSVGGYLIDETRPSARTR